MSTSKLAAKRMQHEALTKECETVMCSAGYYMASLRMSIVSWNVPEIESVALITGVPEGALETTLQVKSSLWLIHCGRLTSVALGTCTLTRGKDNNTSWSNWTV